MTGRKYSFFEEYKTEDADFVIICMNSTAGTAKYEADKLREQGIKAGVLKLRVFRPFPAEEIGTVYKDLSEVAKFGKVENPYRYLGLRRK